MNRALSLALAALASASWAGCGHREFHLSGTVTIASVLQRKVPRDNTVMFIIAKNRGDVPVAVQRIVNPHFPVKFILGPDDLIVPEPPSDMPLRIEVEMNMHGALGRPQPGDLQGRHLNLVYPGERRVHIVVDHQV